MPEISVIVPVYNAEKYLADCLDSLVQQTFQDIEIICVNDGSTDSSLEILEQYAAQDTRIKVYTQENQGVAAARNLALECASGNWLAFCDGDDTVPLNAYEKLYQATNNVDVVGGDSREVYDDGVYYDYIAKAKHKNNLFNALFIVPCVWSKLIRKDVVVSNNLSFPSVVLGEDVIFLAKLASMNIKYTTVSEIVYYHWNHIKENDKSLTHKYDYEHYQAHIHCRNELLRICWDEAKIKEAYYYVYHDMLAYPFDYLFRIQEFSEKEKAFALFKAHVEKYDWKYEKKQFEAMIGLSYDNFINSSAVHFFTTTKIFNHSEMVIKQCEAGMLGFRYIIKYIKAWAQYKIKRMQQERK